MTGPRLSNWIAAILLVVAGTAHAQAVLNAFNVDPSQWPVVSGQFYAFDTAKQALRDLSPDDFRITEFGDSVQVLNVSCPPHNASGAASMIFSFDISGSMGGVVDSSGKMSIDLAKITALSMLDNLPVPPAMIGVQVCSDIAALTTDFLADRNRIRGAVQSIQPVGGNDFGEQLLNPRTGALNLAKTGAGRRAVVVFTDGWWVAMSDSLVRQCEDTCAKYRITFFAVICATKGVKAAGIKSSLLTLAAKTGGQVFDGVTRTQSAVAAALMLDEQIQGDGPCTVQWRGVFDCRIDHVVTLALRSDSTAIANLDYSAPDSSRSRATIGISEIRLGIVSPGKTRDTVVRLSASRVGYSVTGLALSDPRFIIVTPQVPFNVLPDSSVTITVRYTPSDSTYASAALTLEGTFCVGDTLYLSAGDPTLRPKSPTLRMVSPNGGEVFVINDSIDFRWSGVLPSDVVRIEFSGDGGATWTIASDSATNLRLRWKLPAAPSDLCLARVSMHARNEDTMVVIRGKPPKPWISWGGPVMIATFSPDDSLILIAAESDSTRLWRASNGAYWKTLRVPPMNVGDFGVLDYETGFTHGEFSRDGSRVLAGNPVRICDTKTGQVIRNCNFGWPAAFNPTNSVSILAGGSIYDGLTGLLLHGMFVGSGSFGPQGTRIASPGANNAAQFWNATTGSLMMNIVGHSAPVNAARVSPDGKQVLTASNDSTAKLWYSTLPGGLQWTMKGHRSKVIDAVFSPDGKTVLTTSLDRTGKLWSTVTGWQVHSFGGPGIAIGNSGGTVLYTGAISPARYRRDGAVIGAIANDSLLTLWDGSSAKLIRMFDNGVPIVTFDLSADGTRAVTGGADGSVRLWILDTAPLQQDSSDAMWQIVEPAITVDDIDYGPVLFGGSRDSILVAHVRNTGLIPAPIRRIAVTGFNTGDFLLTSGTDSLDLPVGMGRTLELRFSPKSVGARAATLSVFLGGDTVTSPLRGIGVLPSIALVGNVVDFGQVVVDSTRDTTITAILRNVSGGMVNVIGTQMRGPDLLHFSILKGSAPFSIASGASDTMVIRFGPTSLGRVNGSIAFVFDKIGSPAVVTLFGTGIAAGPVIASVHSLAFSRQSCAMSSEVESIAVTNSGGTPLIIRSAMLAGPDRGSFSVPSTFPDTISPAATHLYAVRCMAERAGAIAAALTLHSNASNDSALVIVLSGARDTSGFTLSHDTIDFGMFCPGEFRDTTITVRNVGTLPIDIQALGASPFGVGSADWNLDTSAAAIVPVHFAGWMSDTAGDLSFVDPVCGITKRIHCIAHVDQPSISITSVSVVTAIGKGIDANVIIANASRRDAIIDSATCDEPQFVILPGQLPFSLPAGGSSFLRIRYTPTVDLPAVATIRAWSSPCGAASTFTLTGTPTNATSEVSIPHLEAIAGMPIDIPLFLDSSHDLDSAGAWTYETILTFNGKLLSPVDTGMIVLSAGNNPLRVKLNGRRAKSAGLLRTLACRALSADTDYTPITIESFTWTDGLASVNAISGDFLELNACPGARSILVRYAGEVSLNEIVPNPVRDVAQVWYSANESTSITLSVQDMLGRTAVERAQSSVLPGDHSMTFDTRSLAPGMYSCVLRGPHGAMRYPFVVAR